MPGASRMHTTGDSPFEFATEQLEARQTDRTCENPSIRKEWRELSTSEQAAYHEAVKCLMSSPSQRYPDEPSVANRADDFTWTHMVVNEEAHLTATFLPFHRWFLHQYESSLRSECGYTGPLPYWDWTIDADTLSVPSSPVFDASTGFGGNGRRVDSDANPSGYEYCVQDGPYANTTLTLGGTYPDFVDGEHCLSRTFNNGWQDLNGNFIVGDMMASQYYTTLALAPVYRQNNYYSFEVNLEDRSHAAVHNGIGGDMLTSASPNDPLFYLHHANVDRIWAKWQAANPTRLTDYNGWKDRNETIPAHIDDEMPAGNFSDHRPVVRDYMNIKGGILCYEYST